MGPKRPVTDGWGVRTERETVRARNNLFLAPFARLEPELEKTLVNRVTQRLDIVV